LFSFTAELDDEAAVAAVAADGVDVDWRPARYTEPAGSLHATTSNRLKAAASNKPQDFQVMTTLLFHHHHRHHNEIAIAPTTSRRITNMNEVVK